MTGESGEMSMDGGWGWMVALGACGATGLGVGTVKISGLFFLAFRDLYGGSASDVSWIFVARALVGILAPPISGGFSKRFGSRVVIMTIGVIGCLGVSSLYFSNTIVHAILLFGLCIGVTNGMVYPPSVGMIPQYFKTKRAKANSIAVSGPSLGQFILSPLFIYFIDTYAIRGAFLLYGGCILHITLFGSLLRPIEFHRRISKKMFSRSNMSPRNTDNTLDDKNINKDEKHISSGDISVKDDDSTCEYDSFLASNELKSNSSLDDHVVSNSNTQRKAHNTSESKHKFSLDWSLFREPLYVLYLVGSGLAFFSYQGVSLCLPSQMRHKGLPAPSISILMATIGISDVIGRLSSGFLLDLKTIKRRVRVSTFYSICVAINGTGILILPHLHGFAAFMVYSIVYGVFGGQVMCLIAPVLIDFIGTDKLTNAIGYVFTVLNIGQALIPILMGVIRDVTGSYDWFFLVLGTCGIVSGVLIGFGPCTCLKVFKNRKDLNQQNLPQQKV